MTDPWAPFEIVIPGAAVGKMRPGIRNRGKFAQHYTQDKTLNYESLVSWCAQQVWGARELLDEPLSVEIRIYVEVPQSWSKRRRALALAGQIRPTGKPDIDNVTKSLFDGLNRVVWRDDSIVVKSSEEKWYDTKALVVMVISPVDMTGPQEVA